MIDHFCRWGSVADAKQDTMMLADYYNLTFDSWAGGRVLPNLKVWRPSQDTTSSGVVIHTYLSGWFAIIANRQPISVIINSSRLAFALDRDGPPYVVQNNIGAIITDIAVSPIFAGSHYPIGGYS